MKLYLIRHGESEGNAQNLMQGKEGGLSPHGINQAKNMADRLSRIDFDMLLSSDYERAEETASYIWEKTKKEVIVTPLIGERRHPSEVVGKEKSDPEVLMVRDEIWANYHNKNWHYSDEENFFDLRARALEFLSYVDQLDSKKIAAVTHGFFLRMLIATMMLGENLDPQTFFSFAHFVKTKNTGITMCEKDEHGWHLLAWNDHAHLG